MSNGSDIAAEIAAAFAEAGSATGDGPLVGTLLRLPPVDRTSQDLEPASPVEFPVTLLGDQFSTLDRATGAVAESDDRYYVAADGERPRTTDKLRVGTDIFSIAHVEPLKPGGVPLFYEIRVRK